MSTDLNNPYSPPSEVTEPPWSLPPDTEFLFNDEVIAAVGTLTLPKVCVLTGRKTHLLEQTTTLRASPFWHVVLALVACFGLIACLGVFLWAFGATPNTASLWNLCVILIVSSSIALVMKQRRTLELTWYISDTELEPVERRERLSNLVFAGSALLAFVGWLIGWLSGVSSFGFELIVLIGIGLRPWFRGTQVLTSSGCYKELVLVKGFKSPFIQELRRMIEAHNKRHEQISEGRMSNSPNEHATQKSNFRTFHS